MAFFPGDTLLAVTSEVSRAVLLVDFRSGRVIGSVPTNGRASHMLAMSSAGDELFTTNIVDGSISRLDIAKRETKRVIPVAKSVEGIAISPDGKRVWVGSNGDSIVVGIDHRSEQGDKDTSSETTSMHRLTSAFVFSKLPAS